MWEEATVSRPLFMVSGGLDGSHSLVSGYQTHLLTEVK